MYRTKQFVHTCGLLVGWIYLSAAPSPLQAQNVIFSLEGAEVVPGEEFSVLLSGDLDQPIQGYQLGIKFPPHAMILEDVTLDATDLEGLVPEVFDVSIAHGYGTIKILFSDAIPAGEAIRLARLEFRMVQALQPGDLYEIELMGGLGFPPVPALIFSQTDTYPPAALAASQVKVSDQNMLRIRYLRGVRPDATAFLEFLAFNTAPMAGFSIVAKYDPEIFHFFEADISDTITEAVGAEFVAPIINNVEGYFILGVLLDFREPFENQLIPAAGLEHTIARAGFQVVGVPPGVRSVDVELVDGLGDPQIWNIFAIGNLDVRPVKKNGRVEFLTEAEFMRGDVNGDGRMRISDPIATIDWWIRNVRELSCEKRADSNDDGKIDLADIFYSMDYMFRAKNPPPPPFPNMGLDPTPDELPCPAE